MSRLASRIGPSSTRTLRRWSPQRLLQYPPIGGGPVGSRDLPKSSGLFADRGPSFGAARRSGPGSAGREEDAASLAGHELADLGQERVGLFLLPELLSARVVAGDARLDRPGEAQRVQVLAPPLRLLAPHQIPERPGALAEEFGRPLVQRGPPGLDRLGRREPGLHVAQAGPLERLLQPPPDRGV